MTQQEILTLQKDLELQTQELDLRKKLLDKKAKLNEIQTKEVERSRIELKQLKTKSELQDQIEEITIQRTSKRKRNISKMEKILNLDNQVKKIEAPQKEIVIEPGQSIELADESPTDGITVLDQESLKDIVDVVSEEQEEKITDKKKQLKEINVIPVIDTFPLRETKKKE